jgi:hypothetical protein
VSEREQIKKIWPKAIWFPGDAPPIGTRVREVDFPNLVGTVVGGGPEYEKPPCHCPTCTCEPKRSGLALWWTVEIDGWWKEGGVSYRKTGSPRPGAEPMRVLKYPPSLEWAPEDEDELL